MPNWLVSWVLPYALQIATPILVALAKKAADWMRITLPGPAILILAGAIGEAINQLATVMVGWELPPGVAGTVAVGIREFYSQLIAQPAGLEKPPPEKVKDVLANARPPVPGQLGAGLRSILVLLALGTLAGCGGDGGSSDDEPVLVGEDAEGRTLFDTNGNGRPDLACGGRGGDVNITNTGNGDVSNSGNAGDGGNCVSIAEGDGNDGGNAGDGQDNSSEEVNEAPPPEA